MGVRSSLSPLLLLNTILSHQECNLPAKMVIMLPVVPGQGYSIVVTELILELILEFLLFGIVGVPAIILYHMDTFRGKDQEVVPGISIVGKL